MLDIGRVSPEPVSGHRSQMATFSSMSIISGWPTIRGLMKPRCKASFSAVMKTFALDYIQAHEK
jgi:hypothetical protein